MNAEQIELLKEGVSHYKEQYDLEIESCNRWIKWCGAQNPPDTHGQNFHQGKRSALVFHNICTSKFMDAVIEICK